MHMTLKFLVIYPMKARNDCTETRRIPGRKKVLTEHAPEARDFTQKKGFRNSQLTEKELAANHSKSKVRQRLSTFLGSCNGDLVLTKFAIEYWTKIPIAFCKVCTN